jgi:hypothetical protein
LQGACTRSERPASDWLRQLQCLGPTAEGRVVGDGQAETEKANDRADQTCVWRKASRNTVLSLSAVRIASGEYHGCPPRVVRGAACQAAIASSVNQTVKLPRSRKLASYATQFVTLLLWDVVTTRGVGLERHGGILDQQRGALPISTDPTSPTADPCNNVAASAGCS